MAATSGLAVTPGVEGFDEGLSKEQAPGPGAEARWLFENWIDASESDENRGRLDPLERR